MDRQDDDLGGHMMKRMITAAVVAALAATLASVPAAAAGGADGSSTPERLRVFGLTDNGRLVSFRNTNPGNVQVRGQISGLDVDVELVGIDFRPATGALYGLGDAGGVYTVNNRGEATLQTRLNVALVGTSFGVDFNPTVDRLRIVSDTGQNLRADVSTGMTTVDGTLNYPGPPVVTATGVTGVAYTNNDNDLATATTLYDIDSTLDQVAIQAPANSGSLSPTGTLRVDASDQIGFDIYSEIEGGTTVRLDALAALTVNGRARLYSITLFSGKADQIGRFPMNRQVIDIAIPLNQL